MADIQVLDKLQSASFNKVPFFVNSSTIKFGQKNIIHQYGESDRTEVEHNGLAQDEFTLEMIVYGIGDDYFSKRNALKYELSKKAIAPSILIHPFEGTIECKVVGRPELREIFTELGKAIFTVTFQKCGNKLYPVVSLDNSALITAGVSDVLSSVENNVAKANVSNSFVDSYKKMQSKLNLVTTALNDATKKVNIATAYVDKVSSDILKFRNNINALINLPSKLGSSLTGLFNTIMFVTSKPFDNLTMLKNLFTFGFDDVVMSNLTVEYKEINSNNKIINNAIKTNALALSFGSLIGIDFETQSDLDAVRTSLNDQLNSIYEDLDFDVQSQILSLSSLANAYLDTLDPAKIITFNVDLSPLSIICYNLYGDLNNYDIIRKLNRLDNDVCIDGTIKVVSND